MVVDIPAMFREQVRQFGLKDAPAHVQQQIEQFLRYQQELLELEYAYEPHGDH